MMHREMARFLRRYASSGPWTDDALGRRRYARFSRIMAVADLLWDWRDEERDARKKQQRASITEGVCWIVQGYCDAKRLMLYLGEDYRWIAAEEEAYLITSRTEALRLLEIVTRPRGFCPDIVQVGLQKEQEARR